MRGLDLLVAHGGDTLEKPEMHPGARGAVVRGARLAGDLLMRVRSHLLHERPKLQIVQARAAERAAQKMDIPPKRRSDVLGEVKRPVAIALALGVRRTQRSIQACFDGVDRVSTPCDGIRTVERPCRRRARVLRVEIRLAVDLEGRRVLVCRVIRVPITRLVVDVLSCR